MVNNGANPHHIPIVNPLAQLIIIPYMAANFHEVPRLSTASRGVMTVEVCVTVVVTNVQYVVVV